MRGHAQWREMAQIAGDSQVIFRAPSSPRGQSSGLLPAMTGTGREAVESERLTPFLSINPRSTRKKMISPLSRIVLNQFKLVTLESEKITFPRKSTAVVETHLQ
jgi:hypothetical protein